MRTSTPFNVRGVLRAAVLRASLMALAGGAFAGSVAQGADLVKVAIGQKGAFENAATPLGDEAGIFRKHGIELQIIYTQGSGETVQATVGGSVDIGVSAGTLGVMGAFAKGAPVRIIGATMHGANDLFWYVKPDSPIKSMRDTAGKTVSFSTRGSSTNTAVLAFKDFYKVDLKPVAVGGPPAAYTQTMTGQIDVGWSGGAILLDRMLEGKARIIARASEVPALQAVTPRVLIANIGAIEKRHEVLARFMTAYREAHAWMQSGDPKAISAFARWGGFSEDIAREALKTTYRKADLDPDIIRGVEQMVDEAVTFKYMDKPLSKDQLADLIKIPFK